ncbi:MAG: helix-turn-helix transcriptional regulator [Solirubrobacteraceae bacterium]
MATYTEERVAILRDFGLKVARLRAEHGSQEAFAHEDDVRLHRNAIGVIERGECEPGLLTLLILADAFEDDAFWRLLKSLAVPQQRRPRRLPRAPVTPPAAASPARR